SCADEPRVAPGRLLERNDERSTDGPDSFGTGDASLDIGQVDLERRADDRPDRRDSIVAGFAHTGFEAYSDDGHAGQEAARAAERRVEMDRREIDACLEIGDLGDRRGEIESALRRRRNGIGHFDDRESRSTGGALDIRDVRASFEAPEPSALACDRRHEPSTTEANARIEPVAEVLRQRCARVETGTERLADASEGTSKLEELDGRELRELARLFTDPRADRIVRRGGRYDSQEAFIDGSELRAPVEPCIPSDVV